MVRERKGSYSLHWTVILHTRSEPTAIRLLDRILIRLGLQVSNICLRPWGAELDHYAANFTSPWSAEVDDALYLGGVLQTASQLSATWTMEFANDRRGPEDEPIMLRAWTPYEYRKFALEGVDAASFTLEDGAENGGRRTIERQPTSTVQRTLPGGLVVDVVRRGGD